jgi:opacity protein-like surface antigen
MKKMLATAVLAATLATAAATTASAATTDVEIARLQALRHVTSVNVIDVAARSDRQVFAKRWMSNTRTLTPLQQAIAGKAELVDLINQHVWSFDLKSAYAMTVLPSGRVVIYLGEPPP